MERLILFRHGRAERGSDTGEDFDRPLTERGRADARLIGRVLAGRGFSLDLALVSAAARTVQTWAEIAPAFPGANVQIARALYHADEATLLAAAEAEAAGSVMIVGHNPGLQVLAARLAARDRSAGGAAARLREGLPTAAAAVFAFGPDGEVTAEGMFVPSEHGGGADR